MSSNKSAKNKLIQLYGAECFIDKLHLRPKKDKQRYTSKGQYKRMKQLTYHHIVKKEHGGKATVENRCCTFGRQSCLATPTNSSQASNIK